MKHLIKVLLIATIAIGSSGCLQTLRDTYDKYRDKIEKPDKPNGISMNEIIWLDTNISGWPQTATLTASVDNMMRLQYDKARSWPHARQRATDGGPLVGNAWVIVQVDDQWHAATFEWMRPGQTAKGLSSVRGSGGHIHREPLRSWSPRSGETYGFMVSTPARTADRTVNERSNISMVVWP